MSKAANSIRKGREEAVAYAKGRGAKKGSRVHVPEHVHVKAIRTKLGMTQQAFAGRFGFSINTLRHWEQGKREPEGPHARTCSSSIARLGPFKKRSGSHKSAERAISLTFQLGRKSPGRSLACDAVLRIDGHRSNIVCPRQQVRRAPHADTRRRVISFPT
jgi:putative transcriptional regulator